MSFMTATALAFVDQLRGWATLDDGTILATTDGALEALARGFRVTAHGLEAHSSLAPIGVNAIYIDPADGTAELVGPPVGAVGPYL